MASHFNGPLLTSRTPHGGSMEGAPIALRQASAGYKSLVFDFHEGNHATANATPTNESWDFVDVGTVAGNAITLGGSTVVLGGVLLVTPSTTNNTGRCYFSAQQGATSVPLVSVLARTQPFNFWFSCGIIINDVSDGAAFVGYSDGTTTLTSTGDAEAAGVFGFHIGTTGVITGHAAAATTASTGTLADNTHTVLTMFGHVAGLRSGAAGWAAGSYVEFFQDGRSLGVITQADTAIAGETGVLSHGAVKVTDSYSYNLTHIGTATQNVVG